MNPPVTVTPIATKAALDDSVNTSGSWAGFALSALLVLLTFICATGFYVADRPVRAISPVLSENTKLAASSFHALPALRANDKSVVVEKSKTYSNRPITLTLYSRIAQSFATTRYPQQLTLFPQHDQFQSLFPDSERLTAFFSIDRAYKEQLISQLQTAVPMESDQTQSMHNNTIGTAMMLKYIGTGFPNVGTWMDKFNSIDEIASNFNRHGVPDALIPEQYFRPLLTHNALANVKCNGHSAETVNRRADRYRQRVEKLADRFAVDPNLVLAVAAQESCFYTKAISPVGAQGLMQLMPATASMLGVRDAYNADDNLKGGVRYLSMLQKQFDSQELVLAAYNAGPGSVKRFNGIPPYSETQRYIVKVQSFYRSFAAAEEKAASAFYF